MKQGDIVCIIGLPISLSAPVADECEIGVVTFCSRTGNVYVDHIFRGRDGHMSNFIYLPESLYRIGKL